jgi:hypothetical protein
MYNWIVSIFALSLLIMNQSYTVDSAAMSDTYPSDIPGLEQVKGKRKPRRGRAGRHGRHGRHGRQGAQGVQGAQGAQGGQGTQGASGLTGARGESGATGLVGATGSSGHHGATGPAGPIGPIGPTGCKGEVGATGAAGVASLIVGVAQGPTGTSDDSAIEYPSMQNSFQLVNIVSGYPTVVGGPVEFVPTDMSTAPNPPTNGGFFRINPGGEGIYLLHYGIAAGANADFYLDSTTPYVTAWIMLRVSNGTTTKYYGAIPICRAGLNHPGTDYVPRRSRHLGNNNFRWLQETEYLSCSISLIQAQRPVQQSYFFIHI